VKCHKHVLCVGRFNSFFLNFLSCIFHVNLNFEHSSKQVENVGFPFCSKFDRFRSEQKLKQEYCKGILTGTGTPPMRSEVCWLQLNSLSTTAAGELVQKLKR
jgi:hypothetical protein